MGRALSSCQLGDTFFFVFECGKYDFRKIKIKEWDFLDVVELFRDVLKALDHLHSLGCLHRDVTVANLLVMSDTPGEVVAVLIGPGKACKGLKQTAQNIAPRHCQPPEVDGVTPYDEKLDSWLAGFALARVMCPEILKIPS